ncbi:hypothetical protein [uncultured Marinobacter sp.]|uniref:hypothetical protein n=1 Tax=uncultured Marinobacter sp. TaxID=187379 RepID=UPI0030D90561
MNNGQVDFVDLDRCYDMAGNVISITDNAGSLHNRTIGYDDLNRMISATGFWCKGTIIYDGRGNLTSDGPTIMVFDGAKNLASIDNGTKVIDYAYDGANTRVSGSSPTEDTDVLYTMMGDLLGEYDPSGGFKEYIYVDSKTAANAVDDTAVVRQ